MIPGGSPFHIPKLAIGRNFSNCHGSGRGSGTHHFVGQSPENRRGPWDRTRMRMWFQPWGYPYSWMVYWLENPI